MKNANLQLCVTRRGPIFFELITSVRLFLQKTNLQKLFFYSSEFKCVIISDRNGTRGWTEGPH